MSFFEELNNKSTKPSYLDYIANKLIDSVKDAIRSENQKGKRRVSLLVVNNDYDKTMYCIYSEPHFNKVNIPGSGSLHLGSFEMDKLQVPITSLIDTIKNQLSIMGGRDYKVDLCRVPIYTHPYRGLFDKRVDDSRIVEKGYEETIRIEVNW